MNIFLDCRMVNMSGIGRYIKDLLNYIPKLDPSIKFILAGEKKTLESLEQDYLCEKLIKFNAPIYGIQEQIIGSFILKYCVSTSIQAFHFPHFNVPFVLPNNSIITIHDLIHFKFPDWHNRIKLKAAKFILKNAVKKAKAIIVISKATAQDLSKMFPDVKDKINIIYRNISENFFLLPENEIRKFKMENKLGKYIIYVGNRKKHKNIVRLLEAFLLIQKESFDDLHLVIVGKKFTLTDEVSEFIKLNRCRNIIEIVNAEDKDLPYLYGGAEAFVLPSLYEGFGLTVLEAMACGTPVIASNVSSLPEIVGREAGILVNPYDVNDIKQAIYRILSNKELKLNLKENGLKRIEKFYWQYPIQQTINLYKRIFKESKLLI